MPPSRSSTSHGPTSRRRSRRAARSRSAKTRWSASRSGNITNALADVANFVYLSGGTTALRKSSPIERIVRDVHAGTQHITSGPGMWRAAGQELIGPSDGKQWVLLDLVDAAPPA